MKLLLFSDVHCDLSQCKKLLKMADEVDLVIGAGDLGVVRRGLDKTIDILKNIQKPSVLVPGNSESFEELQLACKIWPNAEVLHANFTTINGVTFYGIGGGIPITPFGSWSYDFTEEEARGMLENCPQNAVLITHSPPKGTLDISSDGRSLGSSAIYEVIQSKHPILVVCGHIHESNGKHVKLGNTDVVNAGPNGMVWNL